MSKVNPAQRACVQFALAGPRLVSPAEPAALPPARPSQLGLGDGQAVSGMQVLPTLVSEFAPCEDAHAHPVPSDGVQCRHL
jgi:hypothetical protein